MTPKILFYSYLPFSINKLSVPDKIFQNAGSNAPRGMPRQFIKKGDPTTERSRSETVSYGSYMIYHMADLETNTESRTESRTFTFLNTSFSKNFKGL